MVTTYNGRNTQLILNATTVVVLLHRYRITEQHQCDTHCDTATVEYVMPAGTSPSTDGDFFFYRTSSPISCQHCHARIQLEQSSSPISVQLVVFLPRPTTSSSAKSSQQSEHIRTINLHSCIFQSSPSRPF